MTQMTKVTNNYQNKPRYNQKASNSSRNSFLPKLPNFGALMFGILIGVFSTSLVVFLFSPTAITLKIPTNGSEPSQQVAINNTQSQLATEPVIAIQEPRFDFYSELTKNIPDSNPAPVNSTPANIASSDLKFAPKPIDSYIVQAGIFRKNAEADAVKAQLTLNGFSAKIEPIKLSDGEIRHKIIMGPFKTEKQAQILQQQLKLIEIESIVKTL